jgi:hypothetical protein
MQTANREAAHFAKSIYAGRRALLARAVYQGFRRLIRVAFAVLNIL